MLETPRGHDRLVVGVVSRCVVFSIIIKTLGLARIHKKLTNSPDRNPLTQGTGEPEELATKTPIPGILLLRGVGRELWHPFPPGKGQFGRRGLHASCPCPCGGRRGILVPSIHEAPNLGGIFFAYPLSGSNSGSHQGNHRWFPEFRVPPVRPSAQRRCFLRGVMGSCPRWVYLGTVPLSRRCVNFCQPGSEASHMPIQLALSPFEKMNALRCIWIVSPKSYHSVILLFQVGG